MCVCVNVLRMRTEVGPTQVLKQLRAKCLSRTPPSRPQPKTNTNQTGNRAPSPIIRLWAHLIDMVVNPPALLLSTALYLINLSEINAETSFSWSEICWTNLMVHTFHLLMNSRSGLSILSTQILVLKSLQPPLSLLPFLTFEQIKIHKGSTWYVYTTEQEILRRSENYTI